MKAPGGHEKKFGMSLETQGLRTPFCGRISRDFAPDITRKRSCEKFDDFAHVWVSDFWPLIEAMYAVVLVARTSSKNEGFLRVAFAYAKFRPAAYSASRVEFYIFFKFDIVCTSTKLQLPIKTESKHVARRLRGRKQVYRSKTLAYQRVDTHDDF